MSGAAGKLVLSRADMADALGLSLSTLDRLTRDHPPGCIRGGKGRETRFNARQFIAWWVSREYGEGDDIDSLRARKLAAEAEMIELDLARAKGEVAPLPEVERAWSRACAALRVNVMNVAQRVAMQLLGETDEMRFKDVLRRELATALEHAAEVDVSLDDDESEDDA